MRRHALRARAGLAAAFCDGALKLRMAGVAVIRVALFFDAQPGRGRRDPADGEERLRDHRGYPAGADRCRNGSKCYRPLLHFRLQQDHVKPLEHLIEEIGRDVVGKLVAPLDLTALMDAKFRLLGWQGLSA